jgi:carbon-monoxide dehydrogenase medium subunit
VKLVPNIGLLASSIRTAADVQLFSPTSCEEVVAILAHAKPPVAIVAGGTDICAQFNEGAEFSSLIDIRRVEHLRSVRLQGSMVHIGGAVPLFEAAAHPLIVGTLRGLADALNRIANVRVRFRATIGGNIMARRTRYEATLLLLAARARLGIREVDGLVEWPIESFLRQSRRDDVLLEYIAIPAEGWIDFQYQRSLRPTMTLAFSAWRAADAISAQAVIATEFLAPVALAIEPIRTPLSPIEAENLARRAFEQLPPEFADISTSNWYLRTAGQVLLRRCLRSLANG